MKYYPAIGLEIHSELATESKMFCSCANDSEEKRPNINVCPVCLGHPGALPVINRKAVELVVKTGLALNCRIPDSSKFDRKNYFYPDLPKGYQISQYDAPFCQDGFLKLDGEKVRVRRVHLEEDTGRLTHPERTGYSLVDFNRAGVPLMELVTEPDITSGRQARKFCEELQLILRYLGVSEANMEKGQMRCEVNISLSKDGRELGTKVEIKNLNSFRAVERATDYEIKRQGDLLETGEKIAQETRGWSDDKQKTFSQRSKEEAQEYRYFPEPDLPPLTGLEELSKKILAEVPELPQARRQRFAEEYKLPLADIETLVYNKGLAEYFEQVVSELQTWIKLKKLADSQQLVKLTANYIITELQKLLVAGKVKMTCCQISPENFAEFVTLIAQKEISSSAAQAVLKEMFVTGSDPSQIIEEKKLRQVSGTEELEKFAKQAISGNPKAAEDFKAGQSNALQFLVGQVMALSKGQANPEVARQILEKLLSH